MSRTMWEKHVNNSCRTRNKPFESDPHIVAQPYPKDIDADTFCQPCKRGILAALFPDDVDECSTCGNKHGVNGLPLECPAPLSREPIAASPQLLREWGYQPATGSSSFAAGKATGRGNNCLMHSPLRTAFQEPWSTDNSKKQSERCGQT